MQISRSPWASALGAVRVPEGLKQKTSTPWREP